MGGFDIYFIVSAPAEKFRSGNLAAITLNPASYAGVTVNVSIGSDSDRIQLSDSDRIQSSILESPVFNLTGCKFDYIDDSYVAYPSCQHLS